MDAFGENCHPSCTRRTFATDFFLLITAVASTKLSFSSTAQSQDAGHWPSCLGRARGQRAGPRPLWLPSQFQIFWALLQGCHEPIAQVNGGYAGAFDHRTHGVHGGNARTQLVCTHSLVVKVRCRHLSTRPNACRSKLAPGRPSRASEAVLVHRIKFYVSFLSPPTNHMCCSLITLSSLLLQARPTEPSRVFLVLTLPSLLFCLLRSVAEMLGGTCPCRSQPARPTTFGSLFVECAKLASPRICLRRVPCSWH